jgi:Mrp family chromosome partitioning ATPase
MSRNFDLMQQLETDRGSQSCEPVEPAFSVRPAIRSRNGHAEWASDEAQRLVQQIFLLQTQEPPRVVVFAGIDHGNGCSRICGAVAEALARNSRKPVCLVEANFRSPRLPELFGTTNHHGLTDALLQEGPIRSFAKPLGHDMLWLLSSGALATDSPNLLSSDRLKTRLAELRAEFDFVIIDAPPLTRYADAIALGQVTDGLILVLEADSTRKKAAQMVAANLRSSNVPILGAVLNKRTFPIPENIYKRL